VLRSAALISLREEKIMIHRLVRVFVILALILPLSAQAFELKHLKTFEGAGAPKSVEISPDGSYAAVMNLEGMDFWLISTATLDVIKKAQFFKTPAQGWDYKARQPINSYAQKPVECDFSEKGRFLWVSLHNAGAVIVYDTTEAMVPAEQTPHERLRITDFVNNKTYETRVIRITTGKTPKVIKITPDGRYALVANWHSSSVSVIDAKQYTVIKTIKLGGKAGYIPRGIVCSADSSKAYVANMGGGTISVIDLTQLEVIDDIPATINPRHIVLSKDQRTLYISDNILGKIIAYDVVAKKTVREVAVGRMARTIALSPDERYIFAVSHEEGKLLVIDTASFEIIYKKDFPFPMGVAVTPDGKQLWVTSYQMGKVEVYEIVPQ
jgi:YVTN family beta-propeller protein